MTIETKNMILYDPKEGTTGFWGLIGYPNKPEFSEIDSYLESSQKMMFCYENAIESCKSNRIEIVNPEAIFNGTHIDSEIERWYKPGDIFDIPQGYSLIVSSDGYTGRATKRWATLVKNEVSQPEPEESQDELFEKVFSEYNHSTFRHETAALYSAPEFLEWLKQSDYTLQRKKQ